MNFSEFMMRGKVPKVGRLFRSVVNALLAQSAAGGDEVRLADGHVPVVVFELFEGAGHGSFMVF